MLVEYGYSWRLRAQVKVTPKWNVWIVRPPVTISEYPDVEGLVRTSSLGSRVQVGTNKGESVNHARRCAARNMFRV